MLPEDQNRNTIELSKIDLITARMKQETRVRNAANWFFFIAAFSLINTLYLLSGRGSRLMFGLGITQFIDNVTPALQSGLAPEAGTLFNIAAFMIDFVIVGSFVGIGVLARMKKIWAFYIGAALYALDAIILLLLENYVDLAFHIVALVGIVAGIGGLRRLQNLSAAALEGQDRVGGA